MRTWSALMTAYALFPLASFKFSTDAMVICETISIPLPTSITTCAMSVPGVISLMVPLMMFRALIFISPLLAGHNNHVESGNHHGRNLTALGIHRVERARRKARNQFQPGSKFDYEIGTDSSPNDARYFPFKNIERPSLHR